MALISATEYKKQKDAGWSPVLLDVRNRDEWEEGHVADAQLLPLALLPLKIKEYAPDTHKPVVVYCASGGRSSLAARALEALGYAHVFDVEGGYGELRAVGA